MAASAACIAINAEFGTGKTIAAGELVYHDPQLAHAANEQISYRIAGQPGNFVHVQLRHSSGGVDTFAYSAAALFTLTEGTYTPTAGATSQLFFQNVGTASVTATITCTGNAAPTITSISPSAGPQAGGNGVTITGTNFTPGSTVTFDGVAASIVNVQSATSIIALPETHAPGVVDVTVTSAGGSVTAVGAYTYRPAPTITSFTPMLGPSSGGTIVTITGTNFDYVTAVNLGVPAASYTVVNSTTITATTASNPNAHGYFGVQVQTQGGSANRNFFEYVSPPTLTSLSPASGGTAGGTLVTVDGTRLRFGGTVSIGGSAPITASYVSTTQARFTTPAHAAGVVDVVFTTPGGSATLASSYTYLQSATVSSVSPNIGSTAGGAVVTITGSSLTGATGVTVGGVAATDVTVNSDTSITATVPARAAGQVSVAVTTAAGTTTLANSFTYVAPPTISGQPSNRSINVGASTTFAATASGATTYQWRVDTGSGFADIANGGVYSGATSPTLAITGATIGMSGYLYQLVASGSVGPAATSSAATLTVNPTAPGAPTNPFAMPGNGEAGIFFDAPTSDGGSAIISYTATSVPGGFTATGPTSPLVVLGLTNGQTYTFSITASNGVGTGTQATTNSVTPEASSNARLGDLETNIGSFAPAFDPQTRTYTVTVPPGTTHVRVTATASDPAAVIEVDGMPAISGQQTDPLDIVTSGMRNAINVSSPDDQSNWTYLINYVFGAVAPAPAITSVAPNQGSIAGTNVVLIAGSGFTGASQVSFGGVAATGFTVVNDTSITATVPAGTAGAVAVRVRTGSGNDTLAAGYTYLTPPAITAQPVDATTGFGGNASFSATASDATSYQWEVDTGSGFGNVVDGGIYSGATTAVLSLNGVTMAMDGHAYRLVANGDIGPPASSNSATLSVTSIVPRAPTGTVAVAGDGEASISFVAPASDGGSAITSYTVTSSPGSFSATGGASPIIVSGLVNGTAYAFSVVATNAIGDSVASVPSNSVTPLSSNPALQSLALSEGVLQPTFGSATTLYAAEVGDTISSVVVTPTAAAAGATIVVNGAPVTSGTASNALPLAVGNNTITVDVTAADGVATRSYVLTVRRLAKVPVLQTASPRAGPTSGGTVLVLTGSGFSDVTGVALDASAAGFAVDSDSQITVTSPAHAAGDVDIVLTSLDGDTRFGSMFTYIGAPTIAIVSPNFGTTGGGTLVTITGLNFRGSGVGVAEASEVTFGGIAATGLTILGPTSLAANVPAHAAGLVDVAVTTPGGTASLAASFTYIAPPAVTDHPADTAIELGDSTTFSVTTAGATAHKWQVDTGGGFVDLADGGVYSGANTATLTITGATLAMNGWRYRAIVTGAVAPDAISGVARLTVGAIEPDAPTAPLATAGDGQATIAFTPPANDGGSPVTGYTVTSAPGGVSATGTTSPITVTNLVNGTSYSFTVVAHNAVGDSLPSASSNAVTPRSTDAQLANLVLSHGAMTPSFASATTNYSATVGNTSNAITITPTASNAGASITVEGVPATSGAATAPLPLVVGANTITIAVTAEDGVGLTNYVLTVTRALPLPTITSVTPPVGTTAGGTTLTLVGTGFTGASAVTINGIAATSITILSDTTLTAVTPAGSAGAANIDVTAPGGVASLAASFTYSAAPAITGHPANAAIGLGGNTSFSVTATDAIGYRWQVDSGAGFVDLADGGLYAGVSTATLTITGATLAMNGWTYRSIVTGAVAPDATSSAATLSVGALVPDAPTDVVAAAGDGQAVIAFAPPASDGGSTITAYTVISTPHGLSGTAAASPIVMAGLSNDTSYTFTVTATNAVGDSAPSAASAPVTPRSADASLTGLSLSSGSLSPAFASATTSYTTSVGHGTKTLTLTPDAPLGATVLVNGEPTIPGAATAPIALATGVTVITIDVTAADGAATRQYTISVTRAAMAITAASPTTGPATGGTVVTLTGTGFTEATDVRFGDNPATDFAIVSDTSIEATTPSGTVGPVDIAIIVPGGLATLADGFTYEAPLSNNASLAGLEPSMGSVTPAFAPDTLAYQLSVASGTPSLSLTPLSADATASITVNGQEVSSGSPSAAIALGSDSTEIKIVVLAEDGVTSRTYTVTVVLSFDSAAVARLTQTQTMEFVEARQSLLSSSIATPGLVERRAMQAGLRPGFASIAPSATAPMLAFGASLVEFNAWNEAGQAAAILAEGAPQPERFNAWVEGSVGMHLRSGFDVQYEGSMALLSVGADYLVNERLLIGVAAHLDNMDDVSGTARTHGTGFLVGPYVSLEVVEGVFFDASLYSGRSWNEVTHDMFSGTFETDRLMVNTSLEGAWKIDDDLTLRPHASLFYLRETAGDYVVHNAQGDMVTVQGFTVEQTRMSLGAMFEYRMVVGDATTLVPFLSGELGLTARNGSPLWERSFGEIGTGFRLSTGANWSISAAISGKLEGESFRSTSLRSGVAGRF